MMHPTVENIIFTVPLTLEAHHLAKQFYQQQSNWKKAKQVYLNTLAVYAVHSYLKWLGIETDLGASESWNPTMQTLANVADLEIKGKGKLECRPVLPNEQVCYIPAEVWSNRIGYVAVHFDASLHEATLLGFVPKVTTEAVPLSQWRSLDALLDRLAQGDSPTIFEEPIHLSQWLQGAVAAGWQTIEELLDWSEPALSFRSAEPVEFPALIMRGKLLDLGSQPGETQVALLLGLMPKHQTDLDIWVKICLQDSHSYLPPGLDLAVLDETGIAVMQAQSRQTEMIQLKFSGLSGEQFSVQLTLGTTSVTETFMI